MHRTLRLYSSPLLALSLLALLIAVASTHAADFGPGFKTQSMAVDGGTASDQLFFDSGHIELTGTLTAQAEQITVDSTVLSDIRNLGHWMKEAGLLGAAADPQALFELDPLRAISR